MQTKLWWHCLTFLLLVVCALRVGGLENIPPGLTHDEASNGHDSAAILRGIHRIYFPVGYGHEPLYNYSVAVTTLFLGQGIFTLRMTSVGWSLCTWVLTVALARRWWGRRAALLTGAALTVGFWPLMMARLGLRAPTLPPLLVASALAYDHALASTKQSRDWLCYLLSGLSLGAGFYTYMASRGMPLLYLIFLIALAITDRHKLRQIWTGTLAVVGIAGLVGLPLFLYLNAHPDLEQRIQQLGSALTAAQSGNFRPLWQNITDSLPMLVWKADPRWLYHISERPALEAFLAFAFLTGGLTALSKLKDRRHIFILLWLGGGLAPALLTTVEYNTLHAIAALPAVFLLVGLGLDTLWQKIACFQKKYKTRFAGPYLKTGLAILLSLGFILTGIESARAYFVTWGQNRDVRVSYHHHVVALGRYLDSHPARTPVVITSLYPGEFHDPYTMEVTLRRDDLSLRWVNGHNALFFPRGDARLYTETQSALAPSLSAHLAQHITPDVTLSFQPDDLPPAIHGYRWDAEAAWSNMIASAMKEVFLGPGDTQPSPHNAKLTCPINYEDIVSLAGYEIIPPIAAPNTTVDILTAWEVQTPPGEELVLFIHMLDEAGTLVTQQDQLDAPSWQWQTGDRFVQTYHLALPPDLAPGTYRLAVGFYTRPGVQRLQVKAGPGIVDHVLLPLDIQAKETSP